jgi:formate hydrogenlyase subunit 6/NADH:ubiquinone oxidoreductase subunit I
MVSVTAYLIQMLTRDWVLKFLNARTAPLVTPLFFRDTPHLTEMECSHCFQCMMICPSPGAIEVIRTEEPGKWKPVIHDGHCIRCGLCVEICPELVLTSGRVHPNTARDGTYMEFTFHIQVNPVTCMGCGNCSVACPVNKEIDPSLAAKGTTSSEDVIMRVNKGLMTVFHEDKCTGCKTCEDQCPTGSIMIARVLEPLQLEES